MKFSLFWDVTQLWLVFSYRSFGTAYRLHLGSRENGTYRLSRNVSNYQSRPRNIPEERGSRVMHLKQSTPWPVVRSWTALYVETLRNTMRMLHHMISVLRQPEAALCHLSWSAVVCVYLFRSVNWIHRSLTERCLANRSLQASWYAVCVQFCQVRCIDMWPRYSVVCKPWCRTFALMASDLSFTASTMLLLCLFFWECFRNFPLDVIGLHTYCADSFVTLWCGYQRTRCPEVWISRTAVGS
jgi:hypothetical protein